MTTFDDFDAWADAIRGANLQLTCDRVETPAWTLGMLPLGDVALQVAGEGGGNICYGANTHTGPILFVPLTHAGEHLVNGISLDEESLLVIPRGADFSIRVSRWAHAWCSVALPASVSLAAEHIFGSRRATCPPGSVPALRRLVHEVAAALLDQPTGTLAHEAAGRDILAAAAACLAAPPPPPPRGVTGRPRLDRAAIIRRAMEAIDTAPTLPTAAELARQTEVHDRTLLRTFQETFGIAPKQYLMLRQLHQLRRILAAQPADDTTVADVLTRHGIWEFGRFSGRYRRHFGELPSETLARARAGRSRRSPPVRR